MYKLIGKQKESKSQTMTNILSSRQNGCEFTSQFVDSRSDSFAQKTLQRKADCYSDSKKNKNSFKNNYVTQCFIKIAVASLNENDSENSKEIKNKKEKFENYTKSRMERATARTRASKLRQKVLDLKEMEDNGTEIGDKWVIANVAAIDATALEEINAEKEKQRKRPTIDLKINLNELLIKRKLKCKEVEKKEKIVSDLKAKEDFGTEVGDNLVIANVAYSDAVNSLELLDKEIQKIKDKISIAEENDPEYFYDDGKPNESKFTMLTNYAIAMKSLNEALISLKILNLKNPKMKDAIVNFTDVESLFKIWMGVDSGNKVVITSNTDYKKRKDENIQGEMRYYHTYEELAWALTRTLGLDQEKGMILGDSKEDEENVARKVLNNASVKQLLINVGKKVCDCISSKMVDLTGMSGDYLELHGKKFTEIIETFNNKQASVDVKNSIAMLHDLSSGIFLNKALTWITDMKKIENPPITINGRGSDKVKTNKFDMRYNVGTVDEASDWTLFMRSLGHNNLWAGPSYTAYQMINMAKEATGLQEEMDAIAYAIYAFWCVEYPHTATPIHTFHEVMSTAQALGVKYDPYLSVTENAKKYSSFTS